MNLDALLEVIFENIFLVVIIVSGLLSVFKRNQKQEESKPKKKPYTIRTDEIQKNEVPEKREKASFESIANTYKSPESRLRSNPNQGINKVETILPSKKKVKSNKQKKIIHTKNEVVSGIIWSEIIGKPRSKQSYRSTKRG
jgi:hypothetical protein